MKNVNRIEFIRKEEKQYHDACYENYRLFEVGSWLYKPVKTVIDLIPLFENQKNIRVLDLGAGVGRNSIPLAQAIKKNNGKVICVDLLDSAINKLKQYRAEYDVEDVILIDKADIGNYKVKSENFDLIVAVSSLEHVRSEVVLDSVLLLMEKGTKKNGVNCLIVNSDVEEMDLETSNKLDALMEVNISTTDMIKKLEAVYFGWEVLNKMVKPLQYNITRNGKSVLLKTNAITYVVRKTY